MPLKREPLSLALVIMNLALLAILHWFGTTVAKQRETEIKLPYDNQKQVHELLLRCSERRSEISNIYL